MSVLSTLILGLLWPLASRCYLYSIGQAPARSSMYQFCSYSIANINHMAISSYNESQKRQALAAQLPPSYDSVTTEEKNGVFGQLTLSNTHIYAETHTYTHTPPHSVPSKSASREGLILIIYTLIYISFNTSSERFSMGNSYIPISRYILQNLLNKSPWLRNLGSAGLKNRKQVSIFPEGFSWLLNVLTNYKSLRSEYYMQAFSQIIENKILF